MEHVAHGSTASRANAGLSGTVAPRRVFERAIFELVHLGRWNLGGRVFLSLSMVSRQGAESANPTPSPSLEPCLQQASNNRSPSRARAALVVSQFAFLSSGF